MPRRTPTSNPYAISYVDGTLTTYRVCLLYDPAKPATGATVPLKLHLSNMAGTNLSASAIVLTALQVEQAGAVMVPATGTFAFSTKLTKGGG
jgi:hypothetical protein